MREPRNRPVRQWHRQWAGGGILAPTYSGRFNTSVKYVSALSPSRVTPIPVAAQFTCR